MYEEALLTWKPLSGRLMLVKFVKSSAVCPTAFLLAMNSTNTTATSLEQKHVAGAENTVPECMERIFALSWSGNIMAASRPI